MLRSGATKHLSVRSMTALGNSNKKSPRVRKGRENPWYHLYFRDRSRGLALRVRSYPCAVTGAPGAAYCAMNAVRCEALGCIRARIPCASHRPATFCPVGRALLVPFIACIDYYNTFLRFVKGVGGFLSRQQHFLLFPRKEYLNRRTKDAVILSEANVLFLR